jgi:hypothetical protein
MSLNEINIPPGAIVNLYKNVLIEPHREAEKTALISNPHRSSLSHLGNNKKQIAVIVNNPDAVHISDAELAFLTSILTACKLGLDDVAIINTANNSEKNFKKLFSLVPAIAVLLFGVKPEELALPVSFPIFQVQHFAGINYLYAPPLNEIEKDKAIKSRLWANLKKLFGL